MQPKERDAQIAEMYLSGKMLKDIAAEVGMAANSVGFRLKKMGFDRPSKPQKRWKDVDEAAVIKAWDDGLATSAISERFAVGRARVVEVLLAAGRDLSIKRQRYDGEGGCIDRSGGAFARMARRT